MPAGGFYFSDLADATMGGLNSLASSPDLARCGGPGYTVLSHPDVWQRGIFPHTSPIYIAVGEWWLFDRDTAEYMLTLVDGELAYIRHTAAHHPAETITYHHAEDNHLAHLTPPFNEAREAIHRRLHQEGIAH